MENQDNLKRKVGRPPLAEGKKQTIEEKREKRRIYMKKYNKRRYYTDPEYAEMKKERAREYYYK